jgi:hypothetical protein
VDGVSTCSVDDLVKAMRMPRISGAAPEGEWNRDRPTGSGEPLKGTKLPDE